VPFIIYDPAHSASYALRSDIARPGLANIAATALDLMGYQAPEGYEPSLIQWK